MPGKVRALCLAIVVLTIGFAAPGPTAWAVPAQTPGTTVTAPARLAIPLLSARRIPDLLRGRIGDQQLAAQLQAVVAKAPETSCLQVTASGRPVFAVNGNVPLEPASANKVLTAFAVLHTTDPNEPVATTAVAAAPASGGVIQGDLYLVGGGDGLLTTAGYKPTFKYQDQPINAFADLADRIKAAGITAVRGGIVGDESRYDAMRYLPTWPERFQRQDDVAPLSALEVNDGVTGYSSTPDAATGVRKPGDPPSLAAATLKTLLENRGITVTGAATAGVAPTARTEIARIESTLLAQVHEMLGWSDNTTAELLGKELGLRGKGAGTAANGTAVTAATLAAAGISTTGLVLNDSSGLDDANRLTCAMLTAVLDHDGPDSQLAAGLPVAGRSGTLQKRMRGTVAEGTVFAKTGSLERPPVASLAGFERTRQGGVVTFAFVQNGAKLNTELQDEVATILFEYPQAPVLTDLVPTLPPG